MMAIQIVGGINDIHLQPYLLLAIHPWSSMPFKIMISLRQQAWVILRKQNKKKTRNLKIAGGVFNEWW